MSFLTILALAVAALVAAPYFAHRLRRQRAEERPFAPARLVPPALPKARRRARLEDRHLFAIRAASVVALALLGASPLIRCSRLAMTRSGTSVAVAIVLDDSMSMRAVKDGKSGFARAHDGAKEILASLHEGDAAALVLAGSPARVGLAATTDLGAARAALEGINETDRGTDLDGAIAIAKTLVADLPQIDRRIVVLSDLADGKSEAPPLGEGSSVPVWIAMPELREPSDVGDCGILAADRSSGRVRVRIACGYAAVAKGRQVVVKDGDKVLGSAPLPETTAGEATVMVTGDETRDLVAELTGKDAIASDDRAPVVVEAGPAALAVVNDRTEESVATGGAPVVEQALAALHVDMAVRPIPQAPDRREDTTAFAAILADDPPGFTPEQRHVLSSFVDRGGVLFLALGRRSAVAPLGANFEPFLGHGVKWEASPTPGAKPSDAAAFFGEAAGSLADLAPQGRVKLAEEDVSSYDPVLSWTDGGPLVARHARGRGEVWISTLPFSVDVSDFALRPGFLALLDAFVTEARERAAPRRSDVGFPWNFTGARQVEVVGPSGPLPVATEGGGQRVIPEVIGAYSVTLDGAKELRVAAPIAVETDLRPRIVPASATSSSLGGGEAVVDVSWMVALALLALVAVETVLRAMTRASENAA